MGRRRAPGGENKGRFLIWIFLLAFFFFWIYPEYFSETGRRTSGSQQDVPEFHRSGARELPSYALQADRNTWPPVREAQESPLFSERLLVANYYVVLDGSGSMEESECSGGATKIQAARKAIAAFAGSLPADANFGLAAFSNSMTQELVPLGRENKDRVVSVLAGVDAVGNTPLRSSIAFAYRKLLEQGERQQGYGEYHLVVVTDGVATEGEDPEQVVNDILGESPVNLHTIGFCIGTNHVLNRPGRSYYRAADNPGELRKGLENVLAEAPAFEIVEFNQ